MNWQHDVIHDFNFFVLRPRLSLLLMGMSMTVIGCSSERSTVSPATFVSDVYYIRAATGSSQVYLEASPRHGVDLVGGQSIPSEPLENLTVAWLISGEDTLAISSENSMVDPKSDLVVRANDGLMQIALVESDAASVEFANWRLVPLDNGQCHLVNDSLGSDLVLSVVNPVALPDGTERYSVEMTGIDNTLVQQWSVVRVGDPPGQYESGCS